MAIRYDADQCSQVEPEAYRLFILLYTDFVYLSQIHGDLYRHHCSVEIS